MKRTIHESSVPSAEQFRMARVGLDFTIRELADMANVNKATIVRIEAGHPVRETTLSSLKTKLSNLGASFWDCDETGEFLVAIRK